MAEDRDIQVATQLGGLRAIVTELDRGHSRLREDMNKGFRDIAAAFDRHTEGEAKARAALEKRVRGLERFRTWCVGVAAGVTSLLAAAKALAFWKG